MNHALKFENACTVFIGTKASALVCHHAIYVHGRRPFIHPKRSDRYVIVNKSKTKLFKHLPVASPVAVQDHNVLVHMALPVP